MLVFCVAAITPKAQTTPSTSIPKFNLRKSGLELERRAQAGTFFDVVGRKSAVAGYENRSMEAWVYPLKLIDDLNVSFQLQGYPLEFQGSDTLTSINVRPEATTLTYTHAAFTVREIIFAPLDEPGIVILFDVQSVLPLSISVSFRPRLKLMWPAGLMTGTLSWEEKEHAYYITEETRRFVGMIGSPSARDAAVMPYQEEPRDVPMRFTIDASHDANSQYLPVIIAGSSEGREKAKESYHRLLDSVQKLYEKNVDHYQHLQAETTRIETPDPSLNTAFDWAKVGIDKGIAINPMLGTGLLAGFRTSGESERPGFAWFFGRDALWTSFALNSCGEFAETRAALEFLRKFQSADGKIPHEISQSASLIPWFTDYPYAWASADATPLYVIAHADHWRASGDLDFLKANWDSIKKAYRYAMATDTDNNGLLENTNFGHGWVEGGALYPPHEEIYMQALWIDASWSLAELADALKDTKVADEARVSALRTSAALEKTFWLEKKGFYGFATSRPQAEPQIADPGPNRDARQTRMNELAQGSLIDEDTVMPAVPLWFHTLRDDRAQSEIDHLGGGAIATDWGTRIISNKSALYDPLSYHNGSVWPLFTGWTALGAYRYGRPTVGFQALSANASLTYTGALGYVTELLSGDFDTPFGRSSHHQIWSEAMVISPALRGLFGIELMDGGRTVRFAPQLPANWDYATVRNVRVGKSLIDLRWKRTEHRITMNVNRREGEKAETGRVRYGEVKLAPSFPLDARIRKVTVGGRNTKFAVKQLGDRQFAEVTVGDSAPTAEIVFTYDEGTDVYVRPDALRAGASSQGLRLLRSRADSDALRLTVEGLGNRSYDIIAISPRRLSAIEAVKIQSANPRDPQTITVNFNGPAGEYVRRELLIPLLEWK
jgi:glycogen debranching enzyme